MPEERRARICRNAQAGKFILDYLRSLWYNDFIQTAQSADCKLCGFQPRPFFVISGGLAQLVRVPASHAGGRAFEPRSLHHAVADYVSFAAAFFNSLQHMSHSKIMLGIFIIEKSPSSEIFRFARLMSTV